ncbi:MAG: hypothetical protein J5710_15055 [Treponema sp.]|nr:hypothetical protein [Treponema sp.]
MEFKYKDFTIEIKNESLWQEKTQTHQFEYTKKYSTNTVENQKKNISNNSTCYGIIIRDYQKEILDSCLLVCSTGGPSSINKKAYLVENDDIYICISNTVFSLAINGLKLNWYKEVDFATAFEIYKMHDDFIIHGELYITRINKDGRIIWQQSGSDIFVLADRSDCFFIENNIINVQSWDKIKYCITYDGKIITKTELSG